MKCDVERDMRKSQSSFLGQVWPAIGHMIGGGGVVSMELSEDRELRALLDTKGGVDAWQVCDAGGLYAIASRVQPVGFDFSTFTVRRTRAKSGAATEWDKISAAVHANDGRVCPKWTIHAYTDRHGKELLSCAAVLTSDLVRHIEIFCDIGKDTRTNRKDGNQFWVVSWDSVKMHACPISETCESLRVWRPDAH